MAYRLRKDFPSLRYIRNRIAEGWSSAAIGRAMGLTKRHVNRAQHWPEYHLATRLCPEDENLSDEFYPPLEDPGASWAERRRVHQEEAQIQREKERLEREREEHTRQVIEENQRVYGLPNYVIKQRKTEAAAEAAKQERREARREEQQLKAAKRIVEHREEILRYYKPGGLEGYIKAWNINTEKVDPVEHAARNYAYERITTQELSRARGVYPGDVIDLRPPHPPWSKETQTAAKLFRNRAQAQGYLSWVDWGIRATCRHYGAELMTVLEAYRMVRDSE